MFILDFVWTRYTHAVASKRAMSAATNAVGIVFFNSVVTLAYVADPWMILPAAFGAFVGTWVAMRLNMNDDGQ